MWVAVLNTTASGRYSYPWVLDPPLAPGEYGVVDNSNRTAARGIAVGALVLIDPTSTDPDAVAALTRATDANGSGVTPVYAPTIEERLAALEASSRGTLTPASVGLGAVNNTADIDKPVSLEQQAAIDAAVAGVVNGAPGALDQLNELAAAMGDDPNFSTTILNALATKQPLSSELSAIAALATVAYGRSLLTLADANALRTAAGLGSIATHGVGEFDLAGAAAAAQAASQPHHANLDTLVGIPGVGNALQQLRVKADGSGYEAFTAPIIDNQSFAVSGTWTKPTTATVVRVRLWSGGGGGGSGRRGAAGTVRCGGGGGASAGYSEAWFDASALPAQVTVTIGAGGAGAAGRTVDNTDGQTGGGGGQTMFGAFLRSAPAGGGGGGTSAGGAAASSAINPSTDPGLAGGAASVTGGAGSGAPTGQVTRAGTGGGAGGGMTAADGAGTGGNGGPHNLLGNTAGGLQGIGNGGNGGTGNAIGITGTGGGGGAGGPTGGGTGGNGGGHGAGGGGGGASLNGFNSGAGGNGSDGYCEVTSW